MYEKGIKPRLDALCLLLSSSGGEGNEKDVMGGSITPYPFFFWRSFYTVSYYSSSDLFPCCANVIAQAMTFAD
jgi:hypothetical protein